jgi:hypothetical protein
VRTPAAERHTYVSLPTMAPRFIVLVVLALLVIDPNRMPEYAAKLCQTDQTVQGSGAHGQGAVA